jgi:ribulose-phosphate 3-epimerase
MSDSPTLKIAPSLLAADFGDLRSQIALAEQGGADWLHLDVMDGRFVPNITFGPPVIARWRKLSTLPFDVHLMIEDPDRYIEEFRRAGADIITVHQEACRHLHRTIEHIVSLGAKAGVSINPATPVDLLEEILPYVDLVLIMTVNPGFGAQRFIPTSLGKIRQIAGMIAEVKPGVFVEVDGGIGLDTAHDVTSAGANVLVAGTAVFGSPDVRTAVGALRSAALRS